MNPLQPILTRIDELKANPAATLADWRAVRKDLAVILRSLADKSLALPEGVTLPELVEQGGGLVDQINENITATEAASRATLIAEQAEMEEALAVQNERERAALAAAGLADTTDAADTQTGQNVVDLDTARAEHARMIADATTRADTAEAAAAEAAAAATDTPDPVDITDPVRELVAASVTTVTPARAQANTPDPARTGTTRISAAIRLEGHDDPTDMDGIGRLLLDAHRTISASLGVRTDVPVVRIARDFNDDEQWKDGDDEADNTSRVARLHRLSASTVLCGPCEQDYAIDICVGAGTPVYDSLPKERSDRGCKTWRAPLGYQPQLNAGIGMRDEFNQDTMDEAYDPLEDPPINADKTCATFECPDTRSTKIKAMYHCWQVTNWQDRFDAEMVRAMTSLGMVQYDLIKEVYTLDKILSKSIQKTAGNPQSIGVSSFLPLQILIAAVQSKSATRIPGKSYTCLLPEWIRTAMFADRALSGFVRDASLESLMARIAEENITLQYYVDGPSTGPGQVLPGHCIPEDNDPITALHALPDEVRWFLFPTGSFRVATAGTLDLGIVRDSTLNKKNVFQMFAEEWFEVDYFGCDCEALSVVSKVCINGVAAAPKAVTCLPATFAA